MKVDRFYPTLEIIYMVSLVAAANRSAYILLEAAHDEAEFFQY